MTTFLIALHVIVSVFLIAVVLLQRGKGAEMGAVFGGGGGTTVFGSRGAGNFLTRLTAGAAIVFMLTSLALSYSFTVASSDRLFDDPTGAEEAGSAPEQPLFEEIETTPAESAAAPEAIAPAEPTDELDGLPALPTPAAPETHGD